MFLGRVCLSVIFIFSFIHKILNWEESYAYLKESLSYWTAYSASAYQIQSFVESLIAFAPVLLLLAMIFEGLGGVLVLVGIKVKAGALLLILFLIPTTLICHPFWLLPNSKQELQMTMFLNNLSILGGLFILFAAAGKKHSRKEEEEE